MAIASQHRFAQGAMKGIDLHAGEEKGQSKRQLDALKALEGVADDGAAAATATGAALTSLLVPTFNLEF